MSSQWIKISLKKLSKWILFYFKTNLQQRRLVKMIQMNVNKENWKIEIHQRKILLEEEKKIKYKFRKRGKSNEILCVFLFSCSHSRFVCLFEEWIKLEKEWMEMMRWKKEKNIFFYFVDFVKVNFFKIKKNVFMRFWLYYLLLNI